MRWWEMVAQRFRAPALMERMFARFDVRRPLVERPGGPEALRRAALRCMACGQTADCDAWLERQEAPADPPAYCRNADLIRRLRRECDTTH